MEKKKKPLVRRCCRRGETGVPFDVRGEKRSVRVRRISAGQLADARPRGRAHPPAARRSPGHACRERGRVRRVRRRQRRRLLPMVS